MTDPNRIDGHKLMFHPERVADWKNGRDDWGKAKPVSDEMVSDEPNLIF